MNQLNKKQKIIIAIVAIATVIAIYYYKTINKNEIDTSEFEIEENKTNETTEKEKYQTIKVHIAGAVNKEGIVELDPGTRISDAIEKAGGLKENAYLGEINLAQILEDGEKIYIPNINEKDNNKLDEQDISNDNINLTQKNSSKTTKSKSTKININNANKEELETLPGIGESTATKIINYRKENGKFKTIEDIKKVKGIGENKYKNIKDLIDIK